MNPRNSIALNILPRTLAVSFTLSFQPSWISCVDIKTGWPPSSPKDVSNEDLVLVDLFSNIRAIVFPTKRWWISPACD